MPYIRKGKSVYNQITGKKEGTSDSIIKAKAYMRALYANTKDTSMNLKIKRKVKGK